jgi:predicted CXXCH cytochrome family protein
LDETEPQPEPGPSRRAPGPARELAVVAAIVVALIVAIGAWLRHQSLGDRSETEVSSRFAPLYAGERSCRECHPGESAHYLRSGHARTLRLASERTELARWLDGKEGHDPEYLNAVFHYRFKDGKLSAERIEPGTDDRLPLEFAFGSGTHATTFVTITDSDPKNPAGLEHRLTYFASGRRLDISPGQAIGSDVNPRLKTPVGRLLDAAQARRCFDCHSTQLVDDPGDVLDVKAMIPNVSCERCHGPGKAHVEVARRGETNLRMPFGEGKETTARQLQLCGHCHRLPEMAPPGAVRPDNPDLARFQPVGLMASKCFKKSEGGISCTTCHDPHARASNDVSSYEAICLGCHKVTPQKSCPVSADKGCIGCHMPRRDAGQGILFADHWIRVHPGTSSSH